MQSWGNSLYQEIGGPAAIDVAVGVFYRKIQTDGSINHFFDDIDTRMMRAMQKDFLIMVMGGPNGYTGKELRKAHAYLLEKGLNDLHIDTVVGHLKTTLEELRVPIAVAA
jgi:hemoglobin